MLRSLLRPQEAGVSGRLFVAGTDQNIYRCMSQKGIESSVLKGLISLAAKSTGNFMNQPLLSVQQSRWHSMAAAKGLPNIESPSSAQQARHHALMNLTASHNWNPAAAGRLLQPSRQASSDESASAINKDSTKAKKEKGPSHTPPPGTAYVERRIKMTPISPNLLAEPYRGAPPKLPWTAYFTFQGWRERYKRILGTVKSVYTVAKCKRRVQGFELAKFKAEALQIYTNVNRMIADGDRNGLRHIITPGEMTNIKKQLKARDDGGWKRIDWSLATTPALRDLEVLQARIVAMDPKDESKMFAQLTVRVRARHKFAAFNARGQLVAGSSSAELPVQDVWVFEHAFLKASHSKWRLAGRLGGLPPTAPATSLRQRIAELVSGKQTKPSQQQVASA